MGLRKGICYRRLERAYTRQSKYKAKSYIKGVPPSKVVRYDIGNLSKDYTHEVNLISKDALQIRHNALESSRLVVNKLLEGTLGNDYFFKIKVYPHHVLREHKMLTGAGADRMSPGMQLAFGKPVGVAARVQRNQVIFSVKVTKDGVETAKKALLRARPRLPGHYAVKITDLAKLKP